MASRLTEISLDCHDPDRLADFWTAVLDWVVLAPRARAGGDRPGAARPTQELLDAVRSGPVRADDVPGRRCRRTRWRRTGCTSTSPPSTARATRRSSGSLALGATRADVGQTGEESWTVLADPEGNEFCVLRSLAPGHFSL